MPPKPRDPSRTDLPENLYEWNGYFTWRDPVTGKKYGLGRNREKAITEAAQANVYIAGHLKTLLDRLIDPDRTIAAFCPQYLAAIETRELAPRTRYNRKRAIAAIREALGDVGIGARQEDAAAITRRCAEWLKTYERAGKRRMAKNLRSALIDLFGEMAAAGWLAVNPAKVIRLERVIVKRSRLTLDTFQRIYETAGQLHPWVRRSMALGLVTLQRLEDVARMGFRDIVDGRLQVAQGKTGTRLRIPLALRLDAVDWSLDEIVSSCRDNVVARRLLHHITHQGRAKPGHPVHQQTISGAFSEARELAGIEVEPGRTPPTFHELRSLGIRLYHEQGYNPQALAGHKDAATTAIYKDSRGAEWIDVAA